MALLLIMGLRSWDALTDSSTSIENRMKEVCAPAQAHSPGRVRLLACLTRAHGCVVVIGGGRWCRKRAHSNVAAAFKGVPTVAQLRS